MRFAADTLAPEAIADASRRCVVFGTVCAAEASKTWRTPDMYSFAGTKQSAPMVIILANETHAGNLTTRRLSEASP